MQEHLRTWMIDSGFPATLTLREMQRGLGSAEMWVCSPAPNVPDVVVRIYAKGATGPATRESLAMRAAASHGLPVPSVVKEGRLGNRPVAVTSFVRGITAAQALAERPDATRELGLAMGELLGKLHQIAAPAGLHSTDDAWIERGGPALQPIRSQLAALPRQGQLLHLDYHPLNILVNDGHISGIVDWENTMAGPPGIDLARTRAILRAAEIGGRFPAAVVAEFDAAIAEGHDRAIGPDPHPNLSASWGLAMTVEDLSRQAGKPGSVFGQPVVDQLAQDRDKHIRTAMNDAE